MIVESPTKAKTIGKYLGSGYDVKATIGHLRDLPTRELGVDVERGFEPKYVTIKGKTKTLSELKKAAKTASTIYLATDPDREGEAIAWHVADQLGVKVPTHRVLFHEITKDAIHEAMEKPGEIDDRKVNAQQARRILDRLVGYKASPILWRSIKTGLSAGRVQTVALRLIVEREREIRAFTPQEYWSIEALLAKDGQTFEASLAKVGGHKPQLHSAEEAQAVVDAVRNDPVRRHQGREAAPAEEPGRAVHHQHAAAGGRQEARLQLAAHHARGAGPVRGARRGRGRPGRPHHLHADRLGPRVGCGHRVGAGLHREELQEALPARRAQRLQHQEERPGAGRARGHPADRREPPARAGPVATSSPTSSGSTSSSGSASSRPR